MLPLYYFDTSALLKKYFFESGTPVVQKIFDSECKIFSSTLSYAEVYSGFFRAHRQGLISKKDFVLCMQDFEVDWLLFGKIDPVDEVCTLVPKLLQKSLLRGADAVHMASFVALVNKDIDVIFVASDRVLLNAVKDFGGKAINPEDV